MKLVLCGYRVLCDDHLYCFSKQNKKMKEQDKRELKYHLAGWILFLICAIFFIVSSWKNHDMLAFLGSLTFLIACIFF